VEKQKEEISLNEKLFALNIFVIGKTLFQPNQVTPQLGFCSFTETKVLKSRGFFSKDFRQQDNNMETLKYCGEKN